MTDDLSQLITPSVVICVEHDAREAARRAVPSAIADTCIRYHSSRTRRNGMKLQKEQCNIDARHQFFSNRIVDMWNSFPAAVVLRPSVAVFKRNLSKLTFSSFLRYS